MLSRRHFLSSLALSPLMGCLAIPTSQAASGIITDTPADVALAKLMEGNVRHMKGDYTADNALKDRMSQFTAGQDPHSVIITCSDSRVVPEIIFDAPPGDLFVMRLAGNVVSPSVIASTEYAVQVLKVRLVVVMGHSGCGAIDAAVREIEKGVTPTGALHQLVTELLPSVVRVRRNKPADLLQASVEENARYGVDRVASAMPTIAPLVTAGQVKVVPAVYDLRSGSVKIV